MALDADVITREPLNVETAWAALEHAITPVEGCYTRNNFAIPTITPESWRLDLNGFLRPTSVSLAELRQLPARTLDVVLECAGNARTYFDPRPEGTAWGERAVACCRFTGAPLKLLLQRAGVPTDAVEIIFRASDGGTFERSLPLDVALHSDTLVAWEMNGAPLAPRHGAPVRLVVPGWYGVASVKWLAEVRVATRPFHGHFQTERYVYASSKGDPHARPVREKHVNSLIVSPAPGARVHAGDEITIRGWAWSGHAPIERVEVSLDGGATWNDATLGPAPSRYAWRGWSLPATAARGMTLVARAHDEAGNVQPERASWNIQGYGNNATRARALHVA